MKLRDINISSTLAEAKQAIRESKNLDSGTKSLISLLILIIELISPRLVKPTSKNSNLPPNQDPYRSKKPKSKSGKKPGGQVGHLGTNLKLEENPDEVIDLKIDRRTLPKGKQYKQGESKRRQVTEISISKYVIEHRAEVLT